MKTLKLFLTLSILFSTTLTQASYDLKFVEPLFNLSYKSAFNILCSENDPSGLQIGIYFNEETGSGDTYLSTGGNEEFMGMDIPGPLHVEINPDWSNAMKLDPNKNGETVYLVKGRLNKTKMTCLLSNTQNTKFLLRYTGGIRLE
jgi:hypothetical protein